jgi:hypothetical protein
MNVSDDGCKILFVSTQEQTWRQCEISTSCTVRLKSTESLLHNKTKQNKTMTPADMQDTMWATGLLLVTPDASMLKCYSCPVAQQCTGRLQEALLALQARTKNTGHHLPEIKENRRYNLRSFRARNNFHTQKQSYDDCPSVRRVCYVTTCAPKRGHNSSVYYVEYAAYWDAPGHIHQEPRLRMSEVAPLRPFSFWWFAPAQLYLVPRITLRHNTQPTMPTRRKIKINALYGS